VTASATTAKKQKRERNQQKTEENTIDIEPATLSQSSHEND